MSEDITDYVNNPRLLVTLCRTVIQKIHAGKEQTDSASMEVQLREIARAIEKLEKQCVPVPDAFRAEKTRIAAALGHMAEASERVALFIADLEALLSEFSPMQHRTPIAEPDTLRRKIVPRKPKTDREILRRLILQGLKELGGAANKRDLFAVIAKNYANNFLPGDFDTLPDGKRIYWQYFSAWECTRMRHEGIIAKTTNRGVWELSEAYR